MTSYWVHKIKVHDDDPFEDINVSYANLTEIISLTSIICVIVFRSGNGNGTNKYLYQGRGRPVI